MLFVSLIQFSARHNKVRAFQNLAGKNSKRSSFALVDNMTDVSESSTMYWFDEVTSTMDKARELGTLSSNMNLDLFAVVTQLQTNGRGTRGRSWISGSKNLLMTVSVKMSTIMTPLTLIPLRIGTLISPAIRAKVLSGAQVYLKWPNDVLIANEKVCGVLIEVNEGRLLVGIGCNVGSSPEVSLTGMEGGRPSTCLERHQYKESENNILSSGSDNQSDNQSDVISQTSVDTSLNGESVGDVWSSTMPTDERHNQLAVEIFEAFSAWIGSVDSARSVIDEFESQMDYSPQRLRNTPTDSAASSLGKEIIPLRINPDGSLQVQYTDNGNEDTLVADYLW